MHPKSSTTRMRPSTAGHTRRTKRKPSQNLYTSRKHNTSNNNTATTLKDEIDRIKDLDIASARQSTLDLAFEDPFNLSPRTQYTISLLGFKPSEYCHWNENYNYHTNFNNDSDTITTTTTNNTTTTTTTNPVERLKEYNFWRNMSQTLSKIKTKRAELIEKKQTFNDIQHKQFEIEKSMLENLVKKNHQQTTEAHTARSRQIDRFVKDRTQQLLQQIDLQNQIKKDKQKQIEKLENEKIRQEQLFQQRLIDSKQLTKRIKKQEKLRWRQLEKSAIWHINQQRERATKRKIKSLQKQVLNVGKDDLLYANFIKKQKKEFKQSQRKRTQLLSKYQIKTEKRKTLLRSKSNHFKSKTQSRAIANKQRRELIQTQRLEKLAKFETKILNDNVRLKRQKKNKLIESQRIRDENEAVRIETYRLAKSRHEQGLKTFVKNLSQSEARRKEFQQEQQQRMAWKREMYNVTRENAKQEVAHMRKSKKTQSAVLEYKLDANNKRDQKKKLLKKLFVQQRGKREDLLRDLDQEYKTKIDNALQYQNVTEMRMLMLEYAKKNREIQEREIKTIEKEALTKLVDKQVDA